MSAVPHALLRVAVLLVTIVACSVLALAGVGILLNDRADRIRVDGLAEAGAEHRSDVLATKFRAMVAQLHGQGLDPRLATLAQSGVIHRDGGELARLAGAYPVPVAIQLIPMTPLGISDLGFDPGRFRNNIEINLISRAFAGDRPGPDTYPYDGRWVFVMAAPVRPDTAAEPSGVLLLRFDAAQLLQSVAAGSQGLLLVLSGGREVFSQGQGTAGVQSVRRSIPGAPMSIEYSPSPDQLAQSPQVSAMPWLFTSLATGLLLITAVLILMRGVRRQLQADARVLAGLGSKQRSSTASLPALAFPELRAAGEAMLQLLERVAETNASDGGSRPRRQAKQTFGAPGPAQMLVEEASLAESDAGVLKLEPDAALQIPAELFRAYDIRGDAGKISDELVYRIGLAIGTEASAAGQPAVIVGADGRDSSPRIRESLVKGLLESGVDVTDLGTVATPMLYFASHHLQVPNAVMITGSHNGPEINGLKIMLGGNVLREEQISALRVQVETGEFSAGQGNYRVSDVSGDYINAICEDIVLSGSPRLVVDCGNGAGAVVASELFEALGASVVTLFNDVDGSFPNRAPDPSDPLNLRQLQSEVIEQRAQLGVAFDGDADRIGIVDDQGQVIAVDRVLMLLARDLLSRHPGADIVYDVKCSQHLARIISDAGGRPIMWRSGHAWIKAKMKECGALLGGEFSGHICFRERWYGFDDALYCAARLLEIIGLEERPLSELLAELPAAASTPEIRIAVPEGNQFALMAPIADALAFDDARLIKVDGLRAEFEDGWGLVRASNTEAALTLRFEARDEDSLARLRQLFRDRLGTVLDPASLSF